MLDILIVTFKPDYQRIHAQISSICGQELGGFDDSEIHLYIWDNSKDIYVVNRLKEISNSYDGFFFSKSVVAGEENIGYGRGQNRLLKISSAPYVLVSNQEIVFEPFSLQRLLSCAIHDNDAAAWEMRQIPYEHPKEYNPVTLETPWVSGAACMFRREAIEQISGFEENIFMYGEDVDLSWRLRAAGWKLRYIAQAAVIHDTYAEPRQVKPLQIIEGNLANLCLRARFGSWKDILVGVLLLAIELCRSNYFPRRRRLLALNFFKFVKHFFYYRWKTGVRAKHFKPTFLWWDFSNMRAGAFFEFRPLHKKKQLPLVSVLVRTCNRPQWLREALLSIKNQTYPNIEVIIVEDGAPSSKKMIEQEFAKEMTITYFATNEPVGRSRAGNIAMSLARGEWLNFLDDDDVFFSDHVEVLVQSALENDVKGVYALAWETPTNVISESPLRYIEKGYYIRYVQKFCRITLWCYNYIPIQSVLFHRSLYEKYGGFEENMEQLEDWNLWTRFTLENDFLCVQKCTSKYRTPARISTEIDRLKDLDAAYDVAIEKQERMLFGSSPREICDLVALYIQSQAVFILRFESIKRITHEIPMLKPLIKILDTMLSPFSFWNSPFNSKRRYLSGSAPTISKEHLFPDKFSPENFVVNRNDMEENCHIVYFLLARNAASRASESMCFKTNPREIMNITREYLDTQVAVILTESQIREWTRRHLFFRILLRRAVPITRRYPIHIGKNIL